MNASRTLIVGLTLGLALAGCTASKPDASVASNVDAWNAVIAQNLGWSANYTPAATGDDASADSDTYIARKTNSERRIDNQCTVIAATAITVDPDAQPEADSDEVDPLDAAITDLMDSIEYAPSQSSAAGDSTSMSYAGFCNSGLAAASFTKLQSPKPDSQDVLLVLAVSPAESEADQEVDPAVNELAAALAASWTASQ